MNRAHIVGFLVLVLVFVGVFFLDSYVGFSRILAGSAPSGS